MCQSVCTFQDEPKEANQKHGDKSYGPDNGEDQAKPFPLIIVVSWIYPDIEYLDQIPTKNSDQNISAYGKEEFHVSRIAFPVSLSTIKTDLFAALEAHKISSSEKEFRTSLLFRYSFVVPIRIAICWTERSPSRISHLIRLLFLRVLYVAETIGIGGTSVYGMNITRLS